MADLTAQEQRNLGGRNAGEAAVAQTNINILAAITKNQGPDAINAVTGKSDREAGFVQQANTSGKFLTGFVEGENPLHACASYTYNLSLHVLDPGEFKAMMENPRGWAPGKTIIGGAGRQWNRLPDWREDFYIDNLELEAAVGNSSEAKGVNSGNQYHFNFTIIEPMTMTLLNRIIRLAGEVGQGGNYTELPYCLEINFNGYDDSGAPMDLSAHTKYLPMKIYNMTIAPGLKGTEYRVEAIPYVHIAYSDSIGALPASFETEARSLEDLFRKDEKAGVDKNGRPIDPTEAVGGEKEKVYKVRSIVAAYNAFQKKRVENNDQEVADSIEVVFAKEILDKFKVVEPKTKPVTQSPSPDRERKKVHGKQVTGKEAGGPNDKVSKFSYAAGSLIKNIIDDAMVNSEYWRKQIADHTKGNEKDGPKDAPLKAWKVTAKVVPKAWDYKRGKYGYDVKYMVGVNVKYNRTDPNLPKSFPTGTARNYDYQFTGTNKDLLTWNIKFDTAYTQNVAADPNKQSATAGAQPREAVTESQKTDKADKGYETADNKGKKTQGSGNDVTAMKAKVTSNSPAATGGNKANDGVGFIAALAYENIFQRSRELCQADIEIIGDPCFIPQEELFIPADAGDVGDIDEPSVTFESGSVFNNDAARSIKMNAGSVHIRLRWMASTDLVEATGGYGGGLGGFEQANISGYHEVFYIKSIFSGGKFTQKIQATRLFDQEEFLSKNAGRQGLDIRGMTVFPTGTPNFSETPPVASDLAKYRDITPTPQVSMVDLTTPQNPLRGLFAKPLPTFTIPAGELQAIPAFGQKYDVPISKPNPAVDPTNLPVGVNVDPATGLPAYKGVLYTGGQNDIAAWKLAVDTGTKFSYATTRPNGNASTNTFTPA